MSGASAETPNVAADVLIETPSSYTHEFTQVGTSIELSSRTVLPLQYASLVPIATASSALGLRFGGLIGITALRLVRIGTLASFELGSNAIKSLLRQDSYVLAIDGPNALEHISDGLLDNALRVLDQSIATTSYLIVAGLELGIKGVHAGIAGTQLLLNAVHAILGDTQTSKAIVAFIALCRRESTWPELNIHKHSLSLKDFATLVIAFCFLQKWGDVKTRKQWIDSGVEEDLMEIVLDIKKLHVTKLQWLCEELEPRIQRLSNSENGSPLKLHVADTPSFAYKLQYQPFLGRYWTRLSGGQTVLRNESSRLTTPDAISSLTRDLYRFARFSIGSYGKRFLSWSTVLQDELVSVSDAVNLPEHQFFSKYTNLPPSALLLSSHIHSPQNIATPDADTGLPLVYYVSLDKDAKMVVLTIRGTLGFDEVLIDSICDYDEVNWQGEPYKVHRGILASARRLITLHGCIVLTTIKQALDLHKDYGLVLCGHSLGGAVAAMLAVLLAEPTRSASNPSPGFVTASQSSGSAVFIPSQRPIHAYTYGCAACFAPELQRQSAGLITTVVHGQDMIPYLSIGVLRDFQLMAMSFKHDSHDAKSQFLQRLRQRIVRSSTKYSGLDALRDYMMGFQWNKTDQETPEVEFKDFSEPPQSDTSLDEDHWPWIALKSLRACRHSDKLVPAGEVFIVESRKYASIDTPPPSNEFASTSLFQESETWPEVLDATSPILKEAETLEPQTASSEADLGQLKLVHVHDVEERFREPRMGPSIFTDHLPGRYERVLKMLEKCATGRDDV